METVGRSETDSVDSSSFEGAVRDPVKEAVVAWVNSAEIRLSGTDWQDKIKIRKQQLSSFMEIGFQIL